MPTLMDLWDFTRLRLLVELERASSLSSAARAVGISQSSASEHLRLLTKAAGEPITTRNGRSLALTPAGRLLASAAYQALTNLSAGESALAARAGLREGTLSIGASSVPGTFLLPAVVAEYTRRCPGVTVQVSVGPTDTVLKWLNEGRIALAVTCSGVDGMGIDVDMLGTDDVVGICRPGLLPISSSGTVERSHLIGHTLLAQEYGSRTRAQAISLHGTASGWKSVWELGSVDAVKHAVKQGVGIGFVSVHAITQESRRAELAVFKVSEIDWGSRFIRAVTMANVVADPASRYFVSLLREAVQAADRPHRLAAQIPSASLRRHLP